MHIFHPTEYGRVKAIFQPLDDHLAISALIAGTSPGVIYADDPDQPRAALARVGYRFHLAGHPDSNFACELGQLFSESLYPQAIADGSSMFTLFYEPGWEHKIGIILPGKQPIAGLRQYYAFDTRQPLKHDWHSFLPSGLSLCEVDQALLARSDLKNLDGLREEMCSERPTVEDFLVRSFGVCMVDDTAQALVGWCLSEYNTGDRCEVGIETLPAYQRRGLATAMTCALLELARAKGIARVGWDCWASNTPSSSTALKAGFVKLCDVPVYFAWFRDADNLAAHGNICFGHGQFEESLSWFEQAFAQGNTWAMTFWNAAQAAASRGQPDVAWHYLTQAIEHGFTDVERIEASEHLRDLHGADQWKTLLARLK